MFSLICGRQNQIQTKTLSCVHIFTLNMFPKVGWLEEIKEEENKKRMIEIE
jgi:hypothetical protein